MSTELPLPTLFANALAAGSKAADLPTLQESTQELIRASLTDLKTLSARVSALSLFSANETLDDISTRNLTYLAVPYFQAELQARVVVSAEREDRSMSSRLAQNYLRTFVSDLETYEIVPGAERELYERKASSVANAAMRRELKIKQFQKEKEIKTRIEVLKKRRKHQLATIDSETSFTQVLSLLPTANSDSAAQTEGEDEEDAETETVLRESTLLLLRLLYASSQSQLESLDRELELLRNAPPAPPREHAPLPDERKGKSAERDEMWKLDAPSQDGKTGPLMDPAGKPLRPFTILPSGASERARFQSQVFGPGYDLPTMSVDEYLEIEKQRGKFISGGGAASAAEPTSSEQLAMEAEMDGTAFGEEKSEEKRLKDENWALYTEANPRGAGNTMNRG